MKKLYIQPETTYQSMNSISTICAGSVRGGTLQFGGEIEDPGSFDPN
ncbi:MAG: hypothetical protein IJT12_04320 [Paludibacteraceae bacterium]|nr:hypothetical protein [Paludibacteraceae bacterium]